ncbi:MAG: penicillin acylase family protein [Pseudomonadota bacterium]
MLKKWFVRLALAVGGIVIVGVLAAWLLLRASLPDLDGEVLVAGIGAASVIERDANGVVTVIADSRNDLAYALGYAHGQDRFFQMDLIRRDSAGELAALFGGVVVDADKRHRLHRFRARAQRALQLMPATHIEILEHYAAGVNQGLADLGTKPFEYFFLGVDPESWLPEDSALAMYTMYLQLNDDRASGETRRALVANVLPREVYEWMYPVGTHWDAPIQGEAHVPAAIPSADVYSIRDREFTIASAHEVGQPPVLGSNNWAVSGAMTESGRALVSNDMHLGLGVPNIYYRARLRTTDDVIDISGVTLPGGPFIVAGSNGHMAWGYTNSQGDWTDAVALVPGEQPGTYQTPDGDREFDEYVEVIEVAGGEPVTVEVRETIWGPVLDDADHLDYEVVVSWIAHHEPALNLGIVDLETATSIETAMAVANRMAIPPQNFVVGDKDGNIGWTLAGVIPKRGDYDPRLPADWSQATGWQGWLSGDEHPRIVNPDSGRLWTANARTTEGEFLATLGRGGYALGARAKQIRDELFAKDTFTAEDMLAIQDDDRALFMATWRELLLNVLDDDVIAADPELADYRDLVMNWTPRAEGESAGYRLVRGFRIEVQRMVFDALVAPVRDVYGDDVVLDIDNQFEAPLWAMVTEQPMHLLPSNYTSWNEWLIDGVRASRDYYLETYDGPLADRTWAEFNTARIQHPISRAVPLLSSFLDMPSEPLRGDSNMPRAQGSNWGASERFSVYPGDEANSLMQIPGGASGHPLSPFYRAGHDDWVQGRPSPFLPGPAAHRLHLVPAASSAN